MSSSTPKKPSEAKETERGKVIIGGFLPVPTKSAGRQNFLAFESLRGGGMFGPQGGEWGDSSPDLKDGEEIGGLSRKPKGMSPGSSKQECSGFF